MDFIVNNWLYFGAGSLFCIFCVCFNFIFQAKRIMSNDSVGFIFGMAMHLFFGALAAVSGLLFCIGAIVHIIRASTN